MNNWKGNYGPLLIAEIGGNHEGNFDYARRLCQLAIDSKSDYIKFQIYTGDTLVSPVESPDRNQHFKKFELSRDQHIELAEMAIRGGARYTASIWDTDIIEWIDPYMDFYKIGSGDLTAYPVIEIIAKTRKPIIISTGLANEDEVVKTVNFIQSLDNRYKDKNYLAVLQCTSMYPIDYGDANLNVIPRLKDLLKITIGYSDHTIDLKALQYAYVMGAEILEFHFTDERDGKSFRDHKVSLTKEEVHLLIDELKVINQLKGSSLKGPTKVEMETNHVISFRRAVYASADLEAGTILTPDLLTCMRPNHGIDARHYYDILGKILKEPVKAFSALTASNIHQ